MMLRLAGLPFGIWERAGSESLFADVTALEHLESEWRRLSSRFAADLGALVVPSVELADDERASTLRVRRQLHKGVVPSPEGFAAAKRSAITALGNGDPFVDSFDDLIGLASAISWSSHALTKAIDEDQQRLAYEVWDLVQGIDEVRKLIEFRNGALLNEMQRCVERGLGWNTRSIQKRTRAMWRIIERATTKSTPRDWHGHLALVSPAEASAVADGKVSGDGIVVKRQSVAMWTPNLHTSRAHAVERVVAMNREPASMRSCRDIRVSLAPLHRVSNGLVTVWLNDPEDPTKLDEVQMRRTDDISATFDILRHGSLSVGELLERLDCLLTDDDLEVLAGVIAYLCSTGVLQASQAVVSKQFADGEAHRSSDTSEGYVDVFRRASCSPDRSFTELQPMLNTAIRLMRLVSGAAGHQARPQSSKVTDESALSGKWESRRLTDLVAAYVESLEDDPAAAGTHTHGNGNCWPIAQGGPYETLLTEIRRLALSGRDQISLNDELLDRVAAPRLDAGWPLDCLVRIASAGSQVFGSLEDVFPAGNVDARFLASMDDARQMQDVVDYQRFITMLEELSGVPLVEVLVPPNASGAANAVRRHIYSTAWTGDGDRLSYDPLATSPARYIPLQDIVLRRQRGQLIAEAYGRPIFPVHHASRIPMPPWSAVTGPLLSCGPPALRWNPTQLHSSLTAFADLDHVPRIVVDDGLIVTGAQWRVRLDELPGFAAADGERETAKLVAGGSLLDDLRTLARVRERLHPVRFVYVSAERPDKPVACDLASTRSIDALKKVAAKAEAWLTLTEMVPSPDQLSTVDERMAGYGPSVSAVLYRNFFGYAPEDRARALAPILASMCEE